MTKKNETALAVYHGDAIAVATDLSDKLKTCTLLPEGLRGKPADILAIVLAGEELGLGPMASIRGIALIKGKPVLSADLMQALVHRSGSCKFFRLVESTDKSATYETHRHGEPMPTAMTFTIEDAKKAGLASRDTWKSYAPAMLRARCSAALARAVYADVLFGCYTPDELDVEIVEPQPSTVDAELYPVDYVLGEIAKATTVARLDELTVQIRAMPVNYRDQIRPVYTARMAELQAEEDTDDIPR